MLSLLFAPFAILFKLDFFSNEFLVFAGPIIDPFAGSAGELYKSILGHGYYIILKILKMQPAKGRTILNDDSP